METPTLLKDENGDPYIRLGENILRLEFEEIDSFYVQRARDELRETPEIVEESVCQLQKLIKGEDGLFLPVDNKAFLYKFLRPCKFYAESAFKVIKKYYKFKSKHPKYSTGLLPDAVSEIFINEIITFLPKRTPIGSRIMVLNLGTNWNPKEVPFIKVYKALLMALEIAMREPKTQVGGVHIIMNVEGFSMSHVCQFTPSLAKLILNTVQECLPIRLKGVHIINQLAIFDLAFNIFKPFLREKLRKRIFFHGTNWKTLQQFIPADCLPERWDGCIGSPDCPGGILQETIRHYRKEYEDLNTYGYCVKEKVVPE